MEKNKSFVEIKGNDKNNIDDIINPLKKYEYVEEKNNKTSKKILLYIFSFLTFVLILIMSLLINKNINKLKNNKEIINNNNDVVTTNIVTTTTTTSEITITDSLICNQELENNGMVQKSNIKFDFSNKKLQNSTITYYFELVDPNNLNNYNEMVNYLTLLNLELDIDGIETIEKKSDNYYSLTIYYKKLENDYNTDFKHNEDYYSVLSKIKNKGYSCN